MSIGKQKAEEIIIKKLNGRTNNNGYCVKLKAARILQKDLLLTYTFSTNWVEVYLEHNPSRGDTGTQYVTTLHLFRFYTVKDLTLFLLSLNIEL